MHHLVALALSLGSIVLAQKVDQPPTVAVEGVLQANQGGYKSIKVDVGELNANAEVAIKIRAINALSTPVELGRMYAGCSLEIFKEIVDTYLQYTPHGVCWKHA